MAFFIVIGCSWLVIALMMLWAHRRNEDPANGHWRAQPSSFFGGTETEATVASEAPPTITGGGPAPLAAKPSLTGA